MKKILTVLGARPQFIKASVVSAALRTHSGIRERVVHTGQHFDANMSGVFFAELNMAPPDIHLGINGGSHGDMTGRMLAEVERVLLLEKPDAVLVYGDTNSTLAGALAAVKLHIPVAHVEAGLRSFNMRMPEEVNRVLTDRVSRWLFTPTDAAAQHLALEGFPAERIIPVGDVMYDAALVFGDKARATSRILEMLCLREKGYVLATVHRQENTDDASRLRCIFEGLEAGPLPVVIPLHPRTRKSLYEAGFSPGRNVRLIDPVGFLDMMRLEQEAALIATDSGGVQKEAFFHRVPCVTLRDETEWLELVECGWNAIVSPTDPGRIAESIRARIGIAGRDAELYGCGNAARIIAEHIVSQFSCG